MIYIHRGKKKKEITTNDLGSTSEHRLVLTSRCIRCHPLPSDIENRFLAAVHRHQSTTTLHRPSSLPGRKKSNPPDKQLICSHLLYSYPCNDQTKSLTSCQLPAVTSPDLQFLFQPSTSGFSFLLMPSSSLESFLYTRLLSVFSLCSLLSPGIMCPRPMYSSLIGDSPVNIKRS
jgi:hypothetical protein